MRIHASRFALRLALVAVLGAGCAARTGAEDAAAAAAIPSAVPTVQPSADPSTGPSASPVPPPEVRLLDAGSRPRQVRRYAYQVGAVETVVMDVTQTVRTEISGGVETEFEIPTLRYTLTVTILAVDAAGTATWEMAVESVEAIADPDAEETVDPTLIATLNDALAPMAGVRITATVDTRGHSMPLGIDTSAMDPTLAQQVTGLMEQSSQLALVLPEAPIGEGARWASTTVATTNGLAFRSRQVVTLRQVEDDMLSLAIQAKQTGLPGPVALPGLPEGFTAELVELTGTTTGRMLVDLGSVVPRSRGEGTIRATLSASDGTTTQTTVSTVDSEIVVRPSDPVSGRAATPRG